MAQNRSFKPAIALLLTVFFVMLITLSLGIGLKYVNDSRANVNRENFMLQSSIVLDDFLKILKNSPDLKQVKDPLSMGVFLAQSSFIPFESQGLKILIEISSARSKINPNVLKKEARMNAFKDFLLSRLVNIEYADVLGDVVGVFKDETQYHTDIFIQNPYLFRGYVASDEHLKEIGEIYKQKFRDNSLDNIDLQKLFYTSSDTNATVDLNYATPLTWQLLIGCDEDRAIELNLNGAGAYLAQTDIYLSTTEKEMLKRFQTKLYMPIVDVKISINKKDANALIRFEYNIQTNKGSNFVFKI